MQQTDYERLATALVESAFYGDKEAAERSGVSLRTLYRWKAALATDDRLAEIVSVKKRRFEDEWASGLAAAIRAAIAFLQRAAQEANPRDPDAIHAVAGALKILAEVGFTKAILDARLSKFIDHDGEEDRPLGAIANGETDGG